MSIKSFVVSDLTGDVINDDSDHVSIIVKDHPNIESAVRLDAAASEVKSLAGTPSDFVVLELHTGSKVENLVVELSKFDKLFKLDAQAALEGADKATVDSPRRGRPRGTAAPRSGGVKAKRDPEQLNAIRAWARENGFEVSDRGRIKAEIEEAYEAAHK